MSAPTPSATAQAVREVGPVFVGYAEGLLAGTTITLADVLAADVPGDGAAAAALREGFAAAHLAEGPS